MKIIKYKEEQKKPKKPIKVIGWRRVLLSGEEDKGRRWDERRDALNIIRYIILRLFL
jgi:hypothetical protein